jgi:hypothetical protein
VFEMMNRGDLEAIKQDIIHHNITSKSALSSWAGKQAKQPHPQSLTTIITGSTTDEDMGHVHQLPEPPIAKEPSQAAPSRQAPSDILLDEKQNIICPAAQQEKELTRSHNKKEEASSAILRQEEQNIRYPACLQIAERPSRSLGKKQGEDASTSYQNQLNQDLPAQQAMMLHPVVSSILREEKQNVIYPSCQQASRQPKQEEDSDDPHPPIQGSKQAHKPCSVESILLLEEKGNIIYPACKQHQDGAEEEAGRPEITMLDHRRSFPEKSWAEKEARRPHPPGSGDRHPRSFPEKSWAEKEARRPHPPRTTAPTSDRATDGLFPNGQMPEPNELARASEQERQPESLMAPDGGANDVEDNFSIDLTENHPANDTTTAHGQEGAEEANNNEQLLATHDQDSDEESNLPVPLLSDEDLVRATLVSEPSHLDLPQASEVDIAQTEAAAAAKRCDKP